MGPQREFSIPEFIFENFADLEFLAHSAGWMADCATRGGSAVQGALDDAFGLPNSVVKLRGTDLWMGWIRAPFFEISLNLRICREFSLLIQRVGLHSEYQTSSGRP